MKRLLVIALMIATWPAPAMAGANPDGVAVIVGNKTYQGRIPAVDYARNDAEAIKRYVTDVLGYREGNIIDLRDATQAQLLSVFGNETTHEGKVWQYVKPGKSDVVVFYSGHGVPGQKDKRGYLLPVNADPDTPEINGYSIDLLYKNLSKIKARTTTVFLDTCFSGESAGGMLIGSASPIRVEARMPSLAEGMTVITAAQGGQLASWDDNAKHGLFTEHLLQALYGKADGNGDGKVTVKEIKAHLDEEMTYAARRRFNRHQQATIMGNMDRVLASYPPGRPPARPRIKVVKEAPKPSPAPNTTELAFWDAIKGSGNPASFEAYLAQHPNGTFAALAKVKIKELKTKRVAVVVPPRLKSAPSPVQPAVGVYPRKPGDTFRDCADCPEMVVVPAGSFRMGDINGGGNSDEKPVHTVTIGNKFAVGKYEVTHGEFSAFVNDTSYSAGGCYYFTGSKWEKGGSKNWRRPGFSQTDRDPVVCVNWDDAKAYVRWLSRKAGKEYRLPSESEWEYMARAGGTAKYPFGDSEGSLCEYGNGADRSTGFKWKNKSCSDGYGEQTAPVGSFQANSFGVYDTVGNAWEWVEDCWHESYNGAPSDGGAWTQGECGRDRVLRGGSWYDGPRVLRSADRGGNASAVRHSSVGFRVARTL